jgi:hypothetical protein
MAQITLNSTGVASNGSLVLQSNGTTAAVTIDTSQRAAFVAGTAALPAITTTGDTNTGIFFPAADTIAFSEGGVEAMQGLIVLVIFVWEQTLLELHMESQAITPCIKIVQVAQSVELVILPLPVWELMQPLICNSLLPQQNKCASTQQVDVGIGTSSPSDKLTVISAGTQVGSTNFRNIARIGLATNDASVLLGYDVSAGSAILASTNNYPIAFWTSIAGTYAEKMRIDSSGNVGIGDPRTTSPHHSPDSPNHST